MLEDYLSKFNGCVIVVSHDRFFMDRTVDHTFVFQGQGVIKDFPGNYSEYRTWKEAHDKQDASAAKVGAAPADAKKRHIVARSSANKLTFKEKREFEQLTTELEQLTAEKKQLDALFASGEQIDGIEEKSRRYTELKDLIDEKELRWLELSEKDA